MVTLNPEQLKEKLDEVVRRLTDALAPRAIYLFGSYAYGDPARASDLDLLVVVPETVLSPYQRDAVAYRALSGLGVPTDVMVYTHSEFDRRSALPISLERTVREKGILIYGA
jgi:predicted nucleotidyltransferase